MKTLEHRDTVFNFAASVRAYCAIVEGAAERHQNQLAEQCAIALADLYIHALQLPEVEPCERAADQKPIEIPSNALPALARLAVKPRESETEYGSDALNNALLTDDLIDIYTELKRGLHDYDSGDECRMSNAVWEWKFSFEVHWREHLVPALYILDRILREPVLPEEPGG